MATWGQAQVCPHIIRRRKIMTSFKGTRTIILSLIVFSLTLGCYLIASADDTKTLQVVGTVYDANDQPVGAGYIVEVTNTDKPQYTETTTTQADGTYGVGFFDIMNPVAETDDVIEVVVKDPQDDTVLGSNQKVYQSGLTITIDVHFEGPLSVVFSSFTADAKNSEVTLKWRAEGEINNLGFDVYRSGSPDGNFVKVSPVYIKGAGTDSNPHNYQFVDENVVVGKTYYYYLETISFSGEREGSHIIKVIIDASGKAKVTDLMKPVTSALLQNFPNPFNPETWIPFRLAQDADVTIRIFDIRGQEVRTIYLGQIPAGYYGTKGKAAFWDGRDSYGQEVSSGMYFYSITAGTFNATKKLTIIK
jgi:hypothetical protein